MARLFQKVAFGSGMIIFKSILLFLYNANYIHIYMYVPLEMFIKALGSISPGFSFQKYI